MIYQFQQQLEAKANSALQVRDFEKAKTYATELIATNSDPSFWHYGNIIHDANQILGLVAFHQGSIIEAEEFLLLAGGTPGSAQLNTLGPSMLLAQHLLLTGERKVVLEYLDLVTRFWASPASGFSLGHLLSRSVATSNLKKIKTWKSQILSGEMPLLNRVPQALILQAEVSSDQVSP